MNIAAEPLTAQSLSQALLTTVRDAATKLRKLTDQHASVKPAPNKWSKKEILGHLIDSASNNHQRFVRAQLHDELRFPEYEQEGWARVQRYAYADWRLLTELWRSYNEHLAYVIAQIDPTRLKTQCAIGDNPPATLQWLIEDYIAHMNHHLRQLER